VLLNAEQVAEANVEELDVLVLDKKKDFRGICEHRNSSLRRRNDG